MTALTVLDLTPPKQEFWFNVYSDGNRGFVNWSNKEACIKNSYIGDGSRVCVVYRIHVRMK